MEHPLEPLVVIVVAGVVVTEAGVVVTEGGFVVGFVVVVVGFVVDVAFHLSVRFVESKCPRREPSHSCSFVSIRELDCCSSLLGHVMPACKAIPTSKYSRNKMPLES